MYTNALALEVRRVLRRSFIRWRGAADPSSGDLVTLRDSLTKAERTLAGPGQALEVLAMRRAFQNTMRDELIAAVQMLTGRTVEAFLSDNLYDPDVAVEIFLLDPSDQDAARTA